MTSARPTLTRRLRLWAAGSVVGGVLVALPDDDDRVFSISGLHGPALVDLVGALVLVGSWLPVAVLLPRLARSAPVRTRRLAAVLGVGGAVMLVVTVAGDLGWWWVPAVVAVLAAQLLLVLSPRARPAPPRRRPGRRSAAP